MEILELKDPKVLMVAQVAALIKRAVESGAMLAPAGFDTIATDIFGFVKDEDQFMVLGAEEGHFKALALGYYPVGNLFPYPTIVLLYNEGSKELSVQMREKLLDMAVSRGYTQVLAINHSGHSDAAWLKGLTPEGVSSKIIGSLGMFEVE